MYESSVHGFVFDAFHLVYSGVSYRQRLKTITYPDLTTTQYAYDTRGRRTSVTDQNSRVTTYAYDDADRLISVTDAQQPTPGVTQYAYDTEKNLTSITDALNRQTSFTYDKFRRVTKTTFPSTLVESYTYDANNNLLTRTDRKGNTITFSYDNLNRMISKQYPGSGGTVSYTYDLANRMTQVSDATGTYGSSYDNMDRLIGTSTQYSFIPGRTFTIGYGYDAASNRISMTDPQAGGTTYSYDSLNRLQSLTDPSSNIFGFGYDVLSRRTSLTRRNGVNTSYSYDSLSHLLSVLHQSGATTIDGATYTYDSAGNRLSKLNQLNGITENYSYDRTYQLTQVGTPTTTESYSYDAVGNRLSALGVASYSYNSSNQLTASADGYSYTYDNNGNTLTKVLGSNTTSFTWDYDNRLTQVGLPGSGGTVTFKYDPFGRRIQKSSGSGTTNYIYDGQNSAEEMDSSGAVMTRYTQGLGVDQPLAMQRSGSYFFEADALGSITTLSDSTGTLPSSFGYGAFGSQLFASGTLLPNFRYTSRDFDAETGLYNYRARYYAPTTGRFLTEDSIRFAGGVNFYTYTLNRPTSLADPTGHCVEGLDTIVCLVVGWGVQTLITSAINHLTAHENLKNLASNYAAAMNATLEACLGLGNCDAAADTAAQTYLNLITATGATALNYATSFPGTLIGGLPPSSKADLALSPIEEIVLEKVKERAKMKGKACPAK